MLLRALGVETTTPPTVPTAPAERCPAAHPDDPTPCGGPVVVTVLDRHNAGVTGCEHHGARLLASVDGARVYPLPNAPEGAATRVFKRADTLPAYVWETLNGGEQR
ncbi:hypothetical protein BIU87_20730 [Streptomyces sp. ZS0098]|nr:hypothetical protein BIU87_20730 [Streptomyces sp. ZS0098]